MPERIRILMIDDDEEDFILTRDIIDEIIPPKYTIEWVSSYDEGLKKILEKQHDVYLVDYQLGVHRGNELIAEAIKNDCEEPLILLTGQNNSTVDNQALQAGAADYLVKGTLSARELESAIRYSIANANYIKEINSLNAQLEKRVQERTLGLQKAIEELNKTKQELSNALQKERELNDLKTRFVSTASHEFRTPLGAILSSTSLIEEYLNKENTAVGFIQEKTGKHIKRIKSSIANLISILNDFLSLEKLEQGRIDINATTFNIIDFTKELLEEMQPALKKGQKISYKHEGKDKEVCIDKQMLKNIMLNLVSNASKYSPDNALIECKTINDNDKLKIIVTDHGMGIPEEDQKHLFERFFRARNATHIQGTGLGLNIVRKYVEFMGGTISFTTVENKGTTFTVILEKRTVAR